MRCIFTFILSAALYPAAICAEEALETVAETTNLRTIATDTTTTFATTPEGTQYEPPRKMNIVEKVINYIDKANKPKPDKRFDFTIVGGPSYNQATSFQLAVMGAALYHSRMDSVTPVSNASLFVQGSLTGFYRVGLSGDHYGPADRYRIHYCADFAHFPLKFWGIGYETESQDANETKYTELRRTFISARP